MSATTEGFRLVTCSSCGEQQLVPDDGANENCYCGKKLPRY